MILRSFLKIYLFSNSVTHFLEIHISHKSERGKNESQ